MSADVDNGVTKVEGLPPELELINEPRDPLTGG
jgi:hypothetical protein